jgi:hypothetical protein
MPSEIMADEPLTAAAMNLMIAMVRLPMMAAKTAIFEPLCVVMDYFPCTERLVPDGLLVIMLVAGY